MTPQLINQCRASISEIKKIFRDEFSDVSKAVFSADFSGLVELISQGEFAAAAILVSGITTPPPGVTVERMEEVKALILAKIPQ